MAYYVMPWYGPKPWCGGVGLKDVLEQINTIADFYVEDACKGTDVCSTPCEFGTACDSQELAHFSRFALAYWSAKMLVRGSNEVGKFNSQGQCGVSPNPIGE